MIELIQDYWLYFLIGQYPNGPLGGLVLTLLLASCGLVLALPLGIVLGLARVSPWRSLRWPVSGFVFVVRGLPLLMVIFWAYFFLPSVTGVKTDQFATMLIALVVFDAAYLAEIVRAGIQGLPRGQMETARARPELEPRDAPGGAAAGAAQHAALAGEPVRLDHQGAVSYTHLTLPTKA